MTKAQRHIVAFSILACLNHLFFYGQAQNVDTAKKFSVRASTEFGMSNLNWSIGGQYNGADYVNVLSELKWKQLRSIGINVGAEYNVWKGLLLKTSFSRAIIISGNVTDTDFAKSNRQDTILHDSFNSNKGKIGKTDFLLGYKLRFAGQVMIAPLMGYSHSSQTSYLLRDLGNVQNDLHSTYHTRWQGVVIGSEFKIPVTTKLIFFVQFSYRQLHYTAVANWNLIESFQHPISFRHRANGYSISNEFGIIRYWRKNISLCVAVSYSALKTGRGVDTLYLTNGQVDITQLNGVKSNAVNLTAGVQYAF